MKRYDVPYVALATFLITCLAVSGVMLFGLQQVYPNELSRNTFQAILAFPVVFGLLQAFVINWAWKFYPIRSWFLQVPNIAGRWEGWTVDQLNAGASRRFVIEIKQKAWRTREPLSNAGF